MSDPAARFEHQQRRWLAELKARNAKIVQVTYPRTANNDRELTVVRGEYLEVSDRTIVFVRLAIARENERL